VVIAVLCDPRRRAYFRSAAPWITVAAGFAVLAPHLAWLVAHDFAPITYAAETYGQAGFADAARTAVSYLVGAAAYVVAPVVLGFSAMRAGRAATADILWPPAGERRTLALAFWTPLLLPALVTLASGGRTTPLWTMCNWTLLPVVLLSSPLLEPDARGVARALACALAWPLLLVAASPVIAFAIHRAGVPHAGADYRLLAAEIERAWQATTPQTLRMVGGQSDLAYGAAFYLPGPPLVFPEMDPQWAPWIDAATVRHDGLALVCPADNAQCIHDVETYAQRRGEAHRTDVTLARRYFGVAAPAERFVIVTIAPQP
jgi:hypothetical protein